MNNDRTKSNAILFSTQNSYAENINKLRNDSREYGGLMNKNNLRLASEKKMNILPFKPAQKILSSELNYKPLGIIILVIIILGFISFFLIYFLKEEKDNKKTSSQTIIALYSGNNKENISLINNKFSPLINNKSIIMRRIDLNNESIVIEENLDIIYNNSNKDEELLIEILVDSTVNDFSKMFEGCEDLFSIDFSYINSSNVKYLSNTFKNCTSLEKINLDLFDISNVERMDGLFYSCENLLEIKGIETLDTTKLNNISEMFAYCENLIFVNLSKFNFSDIINKENVFIDNENLQYIDFGNTTNISGTFQKEYNSSNNIIQSKNITNVLFLNDNHNFDWMNFRKENQYLYSICNNTKVENNCKECRNNNNNESNLYCESCNEGYYLPVNKYYSQIKCQKCDKKCKNCNETKDNCVN